MTRPSSVPHHAPVFTRSRPLNKWISPRQSEMLESLWDARLRRTKHRPLRERSQKERLRHIAETIGRQVGNVRELSWREANRVLRRLLDELRSESASPASAGHPAAVPGPNKPSSARKVASKRTRTPPLPPAVETSGKNGRRAAKNSQPGGRRRP